MAANFTTDGADKIRGPGHVLQTLSSNYNSQTEASSQVQVCDIELTTKVQNSKFFYIFQACIGGLGDADNAKFKITKSAGSTSGNTDYIPADNRGAGTQGQTNGFVFFQDVMPTSASQSQYPVYTFSLSDLIVSTHSAAAVLSFGVWIEGGCWINRSSDRINQETGITALTIMEIGV